MVETLFRPTCAGWQDSLHNLQRRARFCVEFWGGGVFPAGLMFRTLRIFLLVIACGAVAALAVTVVQSEDASYMVHEWLHREQYAKYDQLIVDVAQKHGMPPTLIKA